MKHSIKHLIRLQLRHQLLQIALQTLEEDLKIARKNGYSPQRVLSIELKITENKDQERILIQEAFALQRSIVQLTADILQLMTCIPQSLQDFIQENELSSFGYP